MTIMGTNQCICYCIIATIYVLSFFDFVSAVDISQNQSYVGKSDVESDWKTREATLKDLALFVGMSLCPEEFVQIGFHCYYFSEEKSKSWDDAKLLCEEKVAHLAVIRDEFDNALLVNHMIDNYSNITDLEGWWIGGTDVQDYGHWEWKTTFPFFNTILYFDWCPGEPNDLGGEHCLSLLPQCQFQWNDRDCGFWGFRYICQTFLFPRSSVKSTEYDSNHLF